MAQDLFSELRMQNLRMILDRVQIPLPALGGRHRAVIRVRRDLKARRDPGDVVVVAHPADHGIRKTLIQWARNRIHLHLRFAVFPLRRALHSASEDMHHQLRPVAQAQHRYAQFKQFLRRGGGAFPVYTVRTAGEYDALRRHVPDCLKIGPVGIDLAVDLAFPDSSCHQLIVLTAEIDDDHFLLLHCSHPQLLSVKHKRFLRILALFIIRVIMGICENGSDKTELAKRICPTVIFIIHVVYSIMRAAEQIRLPKAACGVSRIRRPVTAVRGDPRDERPLRRLRGLAQVRRWCI